MPRAVESGRERTEGSTGSRSLSTATGKLDVLIRTFVTSPKPNEYDLLKLTPEEKAYLLDHPDFKQYVKSKIFDCLVDREDRMTRAQKTVFELFFKSNTTRAPKTEEGEVEVGSDD